MYCLKKKYYTNVSDLNGNNCLKSTANRNSFKFNANGAPAHLRCTPELLCLFKWCRY